MSESVEENNTQQSFVGGFGAGTEILLYDGHVRNIEDIKVGNKVMSWNSEPREVIEIIKNRGEIYKMAPIKGDCIALSKYQIMTLVCSGYNKIPRGTQSTLTVDEYERKSETWKKKYKWFHADVIFEDTIPLPIDPYVFGVWLGKSYGLSERVTRLDPLIAEETKQFFNQDSQYDYTRKQFKEFLENGGLLEVKFIPHNYKTSTKTNRLRLLAGILDTDGAYVHSVYELFQKNERLLDDIIFVARSVGLSAYKSECIRKNPKSGLEIYYRCCIFGNGIHTIPCVLPDKKAKPRLQNKNNLVTGLRISLLGIDDFYCLKLDGDPHFLLGDFSVVNGC